MIEFEDGAIQVDATIVAEGLGVEPTFILEGMREGTITSRCEQGIGEDTGRYRLTFFSDNWRFQLVVDESGNVLHSNTVDTRGRQIRASARKPAR